MTALGKALFSVVLIGAGFALASLFGPPDLADQLAETLTPGQPADPWGELRPAPAAAPGENQYAYFARSEVERLGLDAPPLLPQRGQPDIVPTPTPQWDEPEWLSPSKPMIAEGPPPALSFPAEQAEAATVAWDNAAPRVGSAVQDPAVMPAAVDAWNSAAESPASSPPAQQPWRSAKPEVAVANRQSTDWQSAALRRSAPPLGAWESAVQSTQPIAAPAQQTSLPSAWPAPNQPTWGPTPTAGLVSVGEAPTFDAPQTPQEPEPRARTHVVTDGDTLARIAQRYFGDASRAHDLYAWNQDLLSNPELLPIGAELKLVAPAGDAHSTGMIAVEPQLESDSVAPRARLMAPRPAGIAGIQPGR